MTSVLIISALEVEKRMVGLKEIEMLREKFHVIPKVHDLELMYVQNYWYYLQAVCIIIIDYFVSEML